MTHPLIRRTTLASLILASILTTALAQAKESRAYFIEPLDGATVTSPVTVKFGLSGMGVAPAGIDVPNTGHHHLLINLEKLPEAGSPIPADANHVHFGGGQTEATVKLEPGTHTLQLLLGDYLHRPHAQPVTSEKITITVIE